MFFWCFGGVSVVSWRCLGGASPVFRWCFGGVSVVSWYGFSGASDVWVASACFLGHLSVMSSRIHAGVLLWCPTGAASLSDTLLLSISQAVCVYRNSCGLGLIQGGLVHVQ